MRMIKTGAGRPNLRDISYTEILHIRLDTVGYNSYACRHLRRIETAPLDILLPNVFSEWKILICFQFEKFSLFSVTVTTWNGSGLFFISSNASSSDGGITK